MQMVFASQLNQLNELDLLRRCDFLLQANASFPFAEKGEKQTAKVCAGMI